MRKIVKLMTIRCRPAALGTLLALLAGNVGCVGGRWIESPTDAQLPLDPPARGYPTAVPGTAKRTPVKASFSDDPPDAVATVANETENLAPVVAAPAAQQKESRERPATPVPIMAVIPPHLRTPQPASPPAEPITVALPTPPALPAEVQPAPAVKPAAAEPAERSTPIALAAATSPLPAATTHLEPPAPLPVATKLTELPLTASSKEIDSPTGRLERIDEAQSELVLSLEAEIRERRSANANDEELPRLEQNLRLAYLAAGRLDDAASAVLSLDEAQREAYKQLMFSLGVWLSPDEAKRAPLRTAKVLHSLREATTELAAASKLEIRKLAFCERVDYFGWFSEFPKNEFQPKQQVILYVEVDNFSAEKKSPTAFETELQASYQIFDSGGQVIAERKLPLDKEICRNYRRDYFLAYRIYIPESISTGRYRLELTVEDLKAQGKFQGRKFGEGMIEFNVRQ